MVREFEGSERETPPLPDQDLAELPFLDRLSLVEEIQCNYFRRQLSEAFPFGLQDTRSGTIRLAEILLDANRRREGIFQTQQARATAYAEYEAEKQDIRRGERGGRRIEQKVQEAATSWKSIDDILGHQENVQRIVKDVVTDLFISNYILRLRGSDELFAASEDLVSQSTLGRIDILTLLGEVSERLNSKNTHEQPSYFKYKVGSENFVTLDHAGVLRQVVTNAYSKSTGQNQIFQKVTDVSADLLEFFWKNCQSLYNENEEASYSALIYDMQFAALSTQDLSIIESTMSFLHHKLENKSTLSLIQKDYNRVIDLSFTSLTSTVDEIQRDHQFLLPNESEENFFILADLDYLEKWNPLLRRCFYNKYYDRLAVRHGVSALSSELLGREFPLNDSQFATALIRRSPSDARNIALFLHRYMVSYLKAMALNFPHAFESSTLAALVQTRRKWLSSMKEVGLVDEYKENLYRTNPQEMYNRVFRTMETHHEWVNQHFGTSIPAILFFNDGIETFDSLRNAQIENENIFSRIRDENYWFIAENGDQFHVDSNPDLAERNIRSITIYPSPQNSGFRIDLVPQLVGPSGELRTQTYFIDEKGYFSLDTRRSLLRVPLWVRLPFERFILDRLCFITSGALSQRGRHRREGQDGSGKEVDARRSHWRTLTSTPDMIYTLTSQSAREHADFVFQVYGIDIYNENLRRRTVCTLGQDQCITFVRAIVNPFALPNQIVFNPSLFSAT